MSTMADRPLDATARSAARLYGDRLSAACRHTLRLQGGVMSPAAAARFAGHRWVEEAVPLRVPLLRRYVDR